MAREVLLDARMRCDFVARRRRRLTWGKITRARRVATAADQLMGATSKKRQIITSPASPYTTKKRRKQTLRTAVRRMLACKQ